MIQYNQSMNPTHPATVPVAAGQLPAVPLTVEGYATLHQMMRFRRTAWRALPDNNRREIANEAAQLLAEMEGKTDGQSALFSLLGHKGDLMLVHFRETFDQLNQAELDLARLRLNDFLEPATSYLSVIELGLYESSLKTYKALADRGVEPHSDEWKKSIQETIARQKEAMKPRLFPSMPPRRRQELVHASHGGAPAPDERTRPGRTPLCRRSETDYHRLYRFRRLGVGRRPLRRRSPGFQKAHLRDALRPRQRRLCPVRKFLHRIALSRKRSIRLIGRKPARTKSLRH